MTIKEMRREMREKVVPEEIVPQNVVNMLIDEDAEMPKLNAFMFLTRLRALGVGSADFVNLLEGCGAPEPVIAKIKENPRMNLQTLILTLESENLSSDDYLDMLLTAREVWERTLTLRLENAQKAAEDIETDAGATPIGDETEEDQPLPDITDDEEDDSSDVEKELHEMSFTEVLELINKEISDLENPGQSAPKEASQQSAPAAPAADAAENNAEGELSFEAAFDKIKSGKSKPVSDVEDIPDESENDEESAAPAAGRQKSAPADDDDDDDYDDDDDDDIGLSRTKSYHTGAIVGGILGAFLLAGAAFVVTKLVAKKEEPVQTVRFASDSNDIFQAIYHAYNDKSTGGGSATEICDEGVVFGDLLVSGDGQNTLGNYTIGNGVYSVSAEAVAVTVTQNGEIAAWPDIPAPEDARFIAAVPDNGALYTVFSGKRSGYVKITEEGAAYAVYQDGFLTDYEVSEGMIKLATVYTPVFGHTFEIADEDVYLPHAGPNNPTVISPTKILLSDTSGYSYGVSVNYIKINGNVSSACAVIGDPVAAGTDGRFAVTDKYGMLIKTNGDSVTSRKTRKIDRAAFFADGCAICESDEPLNEDDKEEVTWGDIRLFDNDLKPTAIIRGYNVPPVKMWFSGTRLNTVGGYGELIMLDCSDAANPGLVQLEQRTGIVINNSAITYSTTDNGIRLTRYDLNNGSPTRLCEYEKSLTAEGLSSVKLGAPRTAVVDGTASGASYSWFDGVSVISEYTVFESDKRALTATQFDDATGFTAAYADNGVIKAVCADGLKVPQ